MATANKPVIGNLYSPREQYKMHGGNMQRCAPDRDGRVLLLRVKPRLNPDAPGIHDWESPNDRWVQTIAEQELVAAVHLSPRKRVGVHGAV